VWEATRYRERIDGYPIDELMLILEGSVIITDADGVKETFSPGDAFVMPKGVQGNVGKHRDSSEILHVS